MLTTALNALEPAEPASKGGTLQRKCSCQASGETCSRCGAKQQSLQQRKSNGASIGAAIPPIVARVLGSPGTAMDTKTRATMESHFKHDFSDVRLHSDSQANASVRQVGAVAYASGKYIGYAKNESLQRKPTIGASNDPLEQEADRVADQVMAAPADPAANGAPVRIQRFTGHVREGMDTAPASVDHVLASSGRPLEPTLRQDMEQRFGRDFSRVRVHSGGAAEQSAREANANAYTVSHNIVFGDGQFAPESHEGLRLIAHELTHVVQQSGVDRIRIGQSGDKHGQSTVENVQNQVHASSRHIQRYESPEHQDLGDKNLEELFAYIQTEKGKKWTKERGIDTVKLVREIEQDPVRRKKTIRVRPGLELTPGEIISMMGDFYATWQDLQGASKEEIDKILAVMKKERTGGVDANVEYEKITKGRYTKLARVNTKHFAPKNRDAWQDLHMQALAKAKQAGTNKDDSMIEEAYLMDAAGGHFLTDAFASGHMFDSAKVEIAIQGYLKNNPIREENPEMQTVTAGLGMAGIAPALVLKNIHDRMNAEGLEVTNAKEMKWTTYGDNHLKNAEETRKIAAYAVFVSRQQITRAKQGESPDASEVLDLLPDTKSVGRATDQAYKYIPQAVREIEPLVHRNIGMLGTLNPPWYVGGPILPFFAKPIIGTISDPGRTKTLEDYERRKDIDKTTPYPTAPLVRFDF